MNNHSSKGVCKIFNFLKSSPKIKGDPQLDQLYLSIVKYLDRESNSKPIIDDEKIFIKETLKRFKDSGNNPIHLDFKRLSNGCFNVRYKNGIYVGKVKLCGRKTFMQILNGLDGITLVENEPLDVYISNIDNWVKYCRRNKV